MSCTSKWRWPSVRRAASPDGGEGLGQEVVQGLPVSQALTELVGLAAQLRIRHGLELRFERGDLIGDPVQLLDDPPLAHPQDLVHQ
jgi:hypothetical protein